MTPWPTLPLKRVVSPTRAITYGIVQAGENYPNGVPYIRPIDMTEARGIPDVMTLRCTSPEIAAAYRRSRIRTGDLVVSIGPSFGKIMIVPEELDGANLTQGTARVAPDSNVVPRFLYWALQSAAVLGQWSAAVGGATFRALNLEPLANTLVPLPPLDEQRRIADFLDSEIAQIDQLMAARSRQRPLIEERWRAEIRHELEGEEDGHAPSAVPWLARHPVSWRPIALRHLSQIQRGASPRPIDDPSYFDEVGTHAWVRISDVSASEKYLERTEQTLSSLGKARSVALKPGELFVSIAGSVGKPIIAAINCCIHDGFVVIRRPKMSTDFLYYVLKLGDCFAGLGKLGTQLNLNSDTIGSIKIALPPLDKQTEIADRLDLAHDLQTQLLGAIERQVGALRERRQSLISAAISGQIDVTTASGRTR